MNRLRLIGPVAAWIVLAAISAAPVRGGSMGISGGHDLHELLSRARARFDFGDHDAVLLLESRHVVVDAEGAVTTQIRRVVRIGTAMGIRDHADLRIPYNSDTSKMTVTALRTWRDDTWWPGEAEVSPTAVVETLPFVLAQADDYTGMRETMLLHDGVELPCVMETAYEIEERGAARPGVDGLWIFPQRDPAVLVEFNVTVPTGESLNFRCGNGAPEPVVTRGTDGSITYAWTMEDVERLGSPSIADPAAYAPFVAWSTWESWKALGRRIASVFDEAAVLSEALADTLGARLVDEPSAGARARRVAAFVNESTRSVHYEPRFWAFSPRPASRTWETAYGHALDRAVLAAALFRRAGLDANPVYRSTGAGDMDLTVPGLSRFEPIGIHVSGHGLGAFYDPTEGTLTDGPAPLCGRVVWKPGKDDEPSMERGSRDPEATSRFDLVLALEPDENGEWTGTGFLSADGCLSVHAEMVGLHGEALALLNGIAGSVVSGATVENFNPEVFTRDEVVVGFDVSVKIPAPDDRGRTLVVIGDPARGVMTRLPHDVHTYHEHRTSPVMLPCGMTQWITLRLRTGGREIVHLPEAREIQNGAGEHVVRTGNKDGWVTIERGLTLRRATIVPEEWPSLRALLLEEADPANRTVFLK